MLRTCIRINMHSITKTAYSMHDDSTHWIVMHVSSNACSKHARILDHITSRTRYQAVLHRDLQLLSCTLNLRLLREIPQPSSKNGMFEWTHILTWAGGLEWPGGETCIRKQVLLVYGVLTAYIVERRLLIVHVSTGLLYNFSWYIQQQSTINVSTVVYMCRLKARICHNSHEYSFTPLGPTILSVLIESRITIFFITWANPFIQTKLQHDSTICLIPHGCVLW